MTKNVAKAIIFIHIKTTAMGLLKYFAAILLWTMAASSCNSAPSAQKHLTEKAPDLIPGIRLLQEGSEWNKQVREHIQGKILQHYTLDGLTYYRYNWLLGSDTLVTVDVLFNGGKHYNQESLGSIYFYLTTSKDKAVKSGDESFVRVEEGHFESNRFCSVRAFFKVKQYIDRVYGEPNFTESSDGEITYTYDMGAYIVYLGRGTISEPRKGVAVQHYNNAFLHVALKSNLDQP